MIRNIIAVFLGGGIGSVLRYAVQCCLKEYVASSSFPWATFSVNIAGCFLIGLFYSLSARFSLSADMRLLLTTGLCGGFTTFSTFSNESLALLREGRWALALLYVMLSVVLGVAAAFAGSVIR